MRKTKINAPVNLTSGVNKIHSPLEAYIKGKRKLNFNKLLSDSGFNDALFNEIKSFNARETYHAKKTGDTPRKFKPSDIKKDIRSGSMTQAQFKSFVRDISSSGYVRDKKVFDLGERPKTKKTREISFNTQTFEKLKKQFIKKYGEDYFKREEHVLTEYRDLLQQLKQEKLPGVDTNFYKTVNKMGKNLNQIERENILLQEYLKTKDMNTALQNVYNEQIDLKNKKKDELLRSEMKKVLQDNPSRAAQVDNMKYEDLQRMYKDIVGPKWLQDKTKYINPAVFNIRKAKEGVEKEEVKQIIGSTSLKTSVYIDNFVRGIQKLSADGTFSEAERQEILNLISYIPNEFLSDILLDEVIDMNSWYYEERKGEDDGISISYNASSRGADMISDLKRAMLDSLITKDWSFGNTSESKAKELKELQLRLEQK